MENENAKCTFCGQPAVGMTAIVHASPIQKQRLCGRCAAEQHAKTFGSITEADQFIAETTEQLERLEKIIAENPEMPEVDPNLAPFAMTPLTVFKTLQEHLAAFKVRRMEMMTEQGSKERLNYDMKKAIDAEDYERAAELRDRMDTRPDQAEKDAPVAEDETQFRPRQDDS